MADAKARAAARRQAILAGKSDRLAKLTTKAKNDGDPAGNVREAADDPPLADLPSHDSPHNPGRQLRSRKTPQREGSSSLRPSPGPADSVQDSSNSFGLDTAQQEQLLRTLMTSRSREGTPFSDAATNPFLTPSANPFLTPNASNPFLPAGIDPSNIMIDTEARPKTLIEKLLPLLHILLTTLFLLFFLAWNSPNATARFWGYGEGGIWNLHHQREYWTRWASLATDQPILGWGEASQNVLWTYLSLQVGLHAVRILTNSSPPQAPMIVSVILPHLPPPLPLAIQTSLRYLQMFGLLLDDFSMLLFGIGTVIFITEWITA